MNYIDILLKKAESEHNKLKHPYVGTEHLMLALLSEDNEFIDKLKEYNLTYNRFKNKIKQIIGEGTKKSPYTLYTPMLRKVISELNDNDEITNKEIFKLLIENNEGIAIRILEAMKVDISLIQFETNQYLNVNECFIEHREREIEEIIQTLMRKDKCNPLLIGEAGVGKTAIVEEIQRRLEKNEVPNKLKGFKIINIDISSLVAGTKYRGDFEEKINNLLSRVKNSNIILFIDEIHTLVHAGGAEGAISAGDIIKPYLSRGFIKCIGATTINEYHEFFKCDEALDRRFKTIYISEPSIEQTKDILQKNKIVYENFHNIKIDDDLLDEIVNFSDRYLCNKKNPDKSIELLDSCCTNASYYNNNVVSILNLYNIINNKYGLNFNNKKVTELINSGSIILSSKEKINLLKSLNNNIIIDGNKYKSDNDLFLLLGNPYLKHNFYLLKEVIEKPIGIVTIINHHHNKFLKEYIDNIINKRHIFDNFGNIINFDNYLIFLEKGEKDTSIGFTGINDENKVNCIEYEDELLLT